MLFLGITAYALSAPAMRRGVWCAASPDGAAPAPAPDEAAAATASCLTSREPAVRLRTDVRGLRLRRGARCGLLLTQPARGASRRA